MTLEFDEAKSARNLKDRASVSSLETALTIEDTRTDYGERRVRLFGQIEGRLHVAVITYRGDKVRVISLRKANQREERKYAKEHQSS